MTAGYAPGVTRPEAIVLTGVYGVGKSTMAGQIADLLEERDVRFAAIDLDWLSWAWSEDSTHEDPLDRLMLEHLDLLVRNLRRRGNDRFILAGAVMTEREWDAIRTTMAMPTRLVRLTLPLDLIRERIGNEPTTGREHDLAQTERWLAADGEGVPDPDYEVANDGSIVDTASAILAWTGWLDVKATSRRTDATTG